MKIKVVVVRQKAKRPFSSKSGKMYSLIKFIYIFITNGHITTVYFKLFIILNYCIYNTPEKPVSPLKVSPNLLSFLPFCFHDLTTPISTAIHSP